MREIAYAKVNLALHVRERMADGYHRIETVFAFCEDGDVLTVEEGEGLALDITGPFASDLAANEDNLVLRAARVLAERHRVEAGARLTLDKRLPVAAGIGGGSADAAAVLRLLNRWWRLDADEADLMAIAAMLGADVPACLLSRTMWGGGRGDILQPLAGLDVAGTPILLVNPGVPLSTADVFRAWDGVDRGPLGDWRDGRNDLQLAAISLAPEIGEVLKVLNESEISRMSGSGSTCYALFSSEAEHNAAATAPFPAHWWRLASRLR